VGDGDGTIATAVGPRSSAAGQSIHGQTGLSDPPPAFGLLPRKGGGAMSSIAIAQNPIALGTTFVRPRSAAYRSSGSAASSSTSGTAAASRRRSTDSR